MQQYLPLGPTGRPSGRRSAVPLVLLWLTTLAVLGSAYLLARRYSAVFPDGNSQGAAFSAASETRNDERLEDTADHLKHLRAELIEVSERAKRAQARLRQVSHALDQNYLQVYRHRLDIADQNCELALQSPARALEELEFAQANVSKRRTR
jgi:hypothetical protein